MAKRPIKQEIYNEYRKETCDEKGFHKPNHCNAAILSKLDEVLEKLEKWESQNKKK